MLFLYFLVIVVGFFVIIQSEVAGLALIMVIPLVKDLLLLSEEIHPLLNLSLLFTIFTLLSMIYKYSFINEPIKVDKNYSFIFLLFCAILLFSIVYTNDFTYGALKVAKFIFFNGFLFFGSMIVFQSSAKTYKFEKILRYLIVAISVLNIVLLIKYIISGTLIENIIVRFTITGGAPITMARILGLGVILWFIEIVRSKGIKKKLYSIIAMSPIVISLIATNTRGPLIFTLLIIMVYIYLFMDISLRKKIIFTLSFIFIAMIILLVLPENMSSRYLVLFQRGTLNTNTSRWNASSSAMRMIFANRLLQTIANNPMSIFIGSGSGSFAPLFQDYGIWVYPHNIVLEILFEQGLLGLTVFSMLFIFLLKDLIKSNNIDLNAIILLLCLVYFFFNAQVSGDIERNRFIWLFLGALIGYQVINGGKATVEKQK